MNIPFNKPYLTGKELGYIAEAHSRFQLAGDGYFTNLCSSWLERNTGALKALLTHSCTASLEMAAILADICPGDEVIMPSYTFVSTANAFVLRGGVPVYIDIDRNTLNIDSSLIEAAINPNTKAIVVVHYAGVACDMDAIMNIASRYDLIVIEDAAQGILAKYRDKPLGSIGHLACYSFHETKNIISGEGGALLINDPRFIERAEIIREKGTDRTKFFRGQVDKYTWVDIGSSFLPGEITAAFLWAQMQDASDITERRTNIWTKYHVAFESLEQAGQIKRPTIPDYANHNAHLYYFLLPNIHERTKFINAMKEDGINCVFHYVPLHSSPQGLVSGLAGSDLSITTDIADRLVRLPLWIGLESNLSEIISKVNRHFSN